MMQKKQRPVRFIVSNAWGSAIIRGFQLAEQLSEMGCDASVVWAQSPAVSEIRNALCIFVKFVKPETFHLVKRNHNIAVWDLVDIVVERSRMPIGLVFDGVIFPTQRARLDFAHLFGPRAASTVIWSHADSRWKPTRQRRYRLAYLGSRRSIDVGYTAIEGLHFLFSPIAGHGKEIERFFRRACWYSCHFSVRKAGSEEFLYKPNAKLAGAAASGANIILGKDSANLELLAPEYPYYTNSDLASVSETVEYSRATFGTGQWKMGLDMLRGVRERTSRERIARDYLDYFLTFE